MKRIFAMSDIHGQFEAMESLLEHVKFNPNLDKLTVVGDLIDRGPNSALVVKKLKELSDSYPNNVFVTKGNHEEMMSWYVFDGRNQMWLNYGGLEAIHSFQDKFKDKDELDIHLMWLHSLPLIVQDEKYIYSHAGLDPFYGLDEQIRDIIWMEKYELYSFERTQMKQFLGNKKLVHGHTPYSHVTDNGLIISCDLGASTLENGKLALVELTSGVYYSFDLVTKVISKFPIETVKF